MEEDEEMWSEDEEVALAWDASAGSFGTPGCEKVRPSNPVARVLEEQPSSLKRLGHALMVTWGKSPKHLRCEPSTPYPPSKFLKTSISPNAKSRATIAKSLDKLR